MLKGMTNEWEIMGLDTIQVGNTEKKDKKNAYIHFFAIKNGILAIFSTDLLNFKGSSRGGTKSRKGQT